VVDGLQLVGQGIDAGHAGGELGVVGVGQADTGRFGGQAKAQWIALEGRSLNLGFRLQAGQVLAAKEAEDEARSLVEGDGFDQHAGRASRLNPYDPHAVGPMGTAQNGADWENLVFSRDAPLLGQISSLACRFCRLVALCSGDIHRPARWGRLQPPIHTVFVLCSQGVSSSSVHTFHNLADRIIPPSVEMCKPVSRRQGLIGGHPHTGRSSSAQRGFLVWGKPG
jgi:hypothetical protein